MLAFGVVIFIHDISHNQKTIAGVKVFSIFILNH